MPSLAALLGGKCHPNPQEVRPVGDAETVKQVVVSKAAQHAGLPQTCAPNLSPPTPPTLSNPRSFPKLVCRKPGGGVMEAEADPQEQTSLDQLPGSVLVRLLELAPTRDR